MHLRRQGMGQGGEVVQCVDLEKHEKLKGVFTKDFRGVHGFCENKTFKKEIHVACC